MWRAFISRARCLSLACGLSLIWLPTDIAAQMLDFPRPVNQASSFNEPFGLPTVQVTTGALRDRWLKLEEKMEAERLVIRTCEENRASCASRAPCNSYPLLIADEPREVAADLVRSTAQST